MTRIKHSKSTSGHWFEKKFTLVMYHPPKQNIGLGRGLLWLCTPKQAIGVGRGLLWLYTHP